MNQPSVVFLDRDGTLMRDAHYISDPSLVRMIPGAAAAVAGLNAQNVPIVIASNQSGIGRGFYSMDEYEIVRAQFEALLAMEGAKVQATYICPHTPDDRCECRKPRRGLFQRAIAEHNLDDSQLVFIGDRWRDVDAHLFYPGARAGLIPSDMTPAEEIERAERLGIVFPDLKSALESIVR